MNGTPTLDEVDTLAWCHWLNNSPISFMAVICIRLIEMFLSTIIAKRLLWRRLINDRLLCHSKPAISSLRAYINPLTKLLMPMLIDVCVTMWALMCICGDMWEFSLSWLNRKQVTKMCSTRDSLSYPLMFVVLNHYRTARGDPLMLISSASRVLKMSKFIRFMGRSILLSRINRQKSLAALGIFDIALCDIY